MHTLNLYYFIFVFGALLLGACTRPSSTTPVVNNNTNRIFTSDQEVLFFYNVRSLYYIRDEDKASFIRSFKYKELESNSELFPVIRHAYDRNEAYLVLESISEADSIELFWVDPKNNMKGRWVHQPGHPIKDYLFTQKLIQNFNRNVTIELKNKALFTPKTFKAWKVVYEDYNKLISLK